MQKSIPLFILMFFLGLQMISARVKSDGKILSTAESAKKDLSGAGSVKRIINTPFAPKPIGPFSQAVEINGTLYISGQLPLDPITGKMAEGGITGQTEQVMKNIGAILKAAGYDFKDVVKSTCLLSDMENFTAMNSVYGKYYPEDPPARVTCSVVKLPLGALVEIETIAVKP